MMRDVLPDSVYDSLAEHLEQVGNQAQSGWDAGSDEEDTLTGHLGGQLQQEWISPVESDGVHWRWRVKYKKFRGRGKNAMEKLTGADGIVQIEVGLPDGEMKTKGLLFQAKKRDHKRDNKKLIEQVSTMEMLAPGSSAMFFYGPDGYLAANGAEAVSARGLAPSRPLAEFSQQLGTYLSDEFLACRSGQRGMYFDAVRKKLVLLGRRGLTVIPAELRHRILVEVQSSEEISPIW